MPIPLSDLGDRICILGPSNSGKSTLANAIAGKRGLTPVHLDRLFHLPHTDWQPRPFAEFAALHDAAISGDRWVIDGNYSRLLPQRLARATGLILLDLPAATSLFRYLRRCLFETSRAGALDGGRDSIKFDMLRHILLVTPANRRSYARLFGTLALPKLALRTTAAALQLCYREWDLPHPHPNLRR